MEADNPNPRPLWRRLLLGLVPLAIASVALGRWMLAQDAGDEEGRERRPTPVEVAEVRTETLEDARELTGALEPSAEIVVAANVAGTVESVRVDLSAEVGPREVLASLDDREFRQLAAAARAELAVARARLESAQASTEVAARGTVRAEALTERGIASERALDVARGNSLSASADVAMAEAEVARARAASAAASLVLQQTEVRGRWSEEAGTRRVQTRHVDEGARVSIGDPLFTLVDIDPLVIVVMASAADYARMGPGQPVDVTVADGTRVRGEVARVAPAFDPASRQARVEIEVDNADGTLRPGMFVRARTVIARHEAVVTVPETALVTRDGRDAVFVVEGDTARLRFVDAGVRVDGRVAVTGDVSGRVVTLGQQRLTDGAQLRIVADGDGADDIPVDSLDGGESGNEATEASP